jgi:maltose/moltooligosaccharide transporter
MKRPQLSFIQIWNMSFGFLGIQFGFALQNANVSRIFETLGADINEIPILWIAAPVTGLIVQPIIGHMSDNTWNRLGRRRPFFLIGAILASIALFLMPNSPVLWVAAGMLWIMDASINVSMEPFRAFVGDMLPSEQRTTGFAMQSFFIGTGAVIASALPYMMTNWFGIANTAAEGEIPDSVKFAFYIGGAVFFLAVLWTVIASKEYSPDELAKFNEGDQKSDKNKNPYERERMVESNTFITKGFLWVLIGFLLFIIFYFFIYMDYGLGVFFAG